MLSTLALAIVAAHAASGGPLTPTDLRCEYLTDPIGIDEPAPRFSWIDTGSARGSMQASYRIIVSSSPERLKKLQGDLWDSGEVDSTDTSQVVYKGKPLITGQRAWWEVAVKSDSAGGEEAASKPAFWEAGIMSPLNWKAKWLSLRNSKDSDRPAVYLTRKVLITTPVESARAYLSAKGLYAFFIDGHKVGGDLLTPGWTDYHKRIQYQTYDVSDQLKPGEHTLLMVLGDGWYCGHVGLTGGDNYGKKPEGLIQIDIHHKSGAFEQILSTSGSRAAAPSMADDSWRAESGPITSDDLLMGESYDAKKLFDPAKSKLGDDIANEEPVDPSLLVAQNDPTVQELLELKPIKITEPSANTYVFDLGQNMVGHARLKVRGPTGTQIRLRFAEMLNPDGSVYTTNLRGAKATDTYTLSGKGTEVWEPLFTFHGFRYVEVTGYPGTPGTDAITGIVVGTNNPTTGSFQCSSADINQLQHNIVWGQRGNYLSIPTDCPQRDERLGWMGDAEVFSPTACLNTDVAGFLTKWTQDVVDAQSDAGGFSDVSPRMGDPSDGAPAWGDAGVIVPWNTYLAYGDTRLLERRYTAMKKWIEYIDSVNPNHLWIERSNNNFGDWLNVGDDTPRDVIATAYFERSTDLVAETARVLGQSDDAAKYETLRDQIRAAFVKSFVAADGKIKGDTQTDYVMALSFELVPASMRENAAQRLVDHIVKDRGTHLSTGFIGSGLLNPTLTASGHTDVAYKLLMTDTYPSWLYPIRQGATTIWERWDGWTKEKGFQDPGMNSFNHYSFGAVGQWMFNTVAGIALDPAQPGYKHVIVRPVPGGGITWVKGSLKSMNGLISTEWHLDNGHFTLNVTIPPNSTATVGVPARNHEQVTESGRKASESEGVTFVAMDHGSAMYEVKSGTYKFESIVSQ